MVMAIANLAMATGNLGREGVGVNPLRGQNNVQGSCDMGSFPHEFSGYRHVSDAAVRGMFEDAWGVPLLSEPGLRIPNMFEAALDGSFKGLYIQGEDPAQSDPDTQHVTAALASMECIVVQDLFLNETAKYAHVFLPGLVVPGEGRHLHQRRAARARACARSWRRAAGFQDWEVTVLLSNALGYPMQYRHPSEIMDEIARLTPTFAGISYEKLDRLGSIQWPCNDAGAGRHADDARRRVRARQGQVLRHRVRADRGARHAALSAAADDRPQARPVQRRGADAPDVERDVGVGRRRSRSTRTTPRCAAFGTATALASRAARARSCCRPR